MAGRSLKLKLLINKNLSRKVNKMAVSTSASMSASLKLKLLIDKKTQKVVFAEAGKDTVDFLFTMLSLPVSTVIRLLSNQNMVGCIGNIYESIENMEEDYIQPNLNKDNLLKPKTPICTIDCRAVTRLLTFVDGYGGESTDVAVAAEGGFVKGVVTYMVMDDLVIKPMSIISGITILTYFNVKDVGALEEKLVYLDMPKGLKLLKESLMNSKNVLTSVFLGNNIVKEDEENQRIRKRKMMRKRRN